MNKYKFVGAVVLVSIFICALIVGLVREKSPNGIIIEGIAFKDNSWLADRNQYQNDVKNHLTSAPWVWEKTYRGTGPEAEIAENPIMPRTSGVFKIKFNTDNTLVGYTDCNSFSGMYELSEGDILFDKIVTTQFHCDSSQESDFLPTLKRGQISRGADSFIIEHDQTVFFIKDINFPDFL